MPIQKKIPTLEEVEALIEEGTSNIKDSIKNPILLTNEDLNLYKGDDKLGVYYGGGGNASANKPANVSAFGLIVVKTASGNYSQLMFAGKEGYYDLIKRDYVNSAWTEWENVSESRKLNVNIDCDHEYEITGKTGHEYAVAVPDGQVLIKRINGQTRRKSLNLIDGLYCVTSATSQYASSFKCTKLDVVVGKQYTINFKTKNTGAELYVNEHLFSYKDFRCDGREYTFVFTCQSIGDKLIIFKNTIDNTGRFDPMPIYNIQILEGDYTNKDIPLYQEYDDTLVNSKCNLKSTGRNLLTLSPQNISRNGIKLNVFNSNIIECSGTATAGAFIRLRSSIFLPKGTYKIILETLNGTFQGSIYVQTVDGGATWIGSNNSSSFEWKGGNLAVWEQIVSGNANFKIRVMLVYGSEAIDFEPYEESSMLVDKELGVYDYIDNVSKLLIKQTSQVFTFDGSGDENWAIVGSQSSGNTNLFRWQGVSGSLRFIGNILYSNIFGKGNESIWGNDIECIGNTATEILIRLSKEKCPDLNSFKTWLASANLQVVFKLSTPTTEPINLEAGYQVWNSGLQIQETETLPYVLEKEYAVSLYSQILAVTSIVNSIPDDVVSKSWVEQTYIKKDAFSIDEDGKLIIDI